MKCDFRIFFRPEHVEGLPNLIVSCGFIQAIPIPGARDAAMAADNFGAMGWRLDDAEVAALQDEVDGNRSAIATNAAIIQALREAVQARGG